MRNHSAFTTSHKTPSGNPPTDDHLVPRAEALSASKAAKVVIAELTCAFPGPMGIAVRNYAGGEYINGIIPF